MYYASHMKPGYDDRGKVYVKYGPPDSKFAAPVGSSLTVYATQITDVLQTRPNESWAYTSVDRNLSFDFGIEML